MKTNNKSELLALKQDRLDGIISVEEYQQALAELKQKDASKLSYKAQQGRSKGYNEKE